MIAIEHIDNEIKFHEEKLKELIESKKRLKDNIIKDADPYKLLTSRGYRIEVALAMTDTIKSASKLLNVSERTIYRFLEDKAK